MEIRFTIANGQILSIFDRVICPSYNSGEVLSFLVFILSLSIPILRVNMMVTVS